MKKPRLGNLILVFFSTAITPSIAEFGLRLLAPNLASEPVTSNQYNFYRYDPVLGWSTYRMRAARFPGPSSVTS